ncbi:MAG: trehalase family glycosidase [Armatimonadota bacterium]|nr:trehalase family glycosidase [Armatimonadota bacterium]
MEMKTPLTMMGILLLWLVCAVALAATPAKSAAKGGNMTQRFLDTLQGKLRFDSAHAPWGGLAFCAHYSWFGVNKQDKLGIEGLWLYYNRAPRLLSSEFLTFEVSRSGQTWGASSNRADLPLEIQEQGDHGFSGSIAFAGSDIICYHARVDPGSGATVTARLSIPASDPRFIRKAKYDPAKRLLTIDTRLPRTDVRDPDPDHPFTICVIVPKAFTPSAVPTTSETDQAVQLTFSAGAEDFEGEQTFIVGIGEGPTADEIKMRLRGMARVGSKDSRAASRRWLDNSLDKFTFEGVPQDLRLHYAKAVYQLLSNTKAPRGRLKHPAGYPSRGVYCTEFLWDVAFSSIAVAQFNQRLAEGYLLNLVENQEADGKIPMFICATWNRPGESEPPLIAWSAWSLYEKSRNKKLISAVYRPLGRMVEWWFKNRDQDGNGVVEYQDPLESGWDNSPRFDAGRIEGVDLNAYLNREMRLLAKMAKVLGKQEDADEWERRTAEHAERVSAVLFDPENEIYYDRLVEQKSLLKILTPASFTPLWTGMPAPEKTARSMIERYLLDPDRFFGKYPFPTVAYNEPTYTPGGWWRGPVWVNIAWIMVETLKANGFEKESMEASSRLIDMMLGNDELYELYNSSTGKGQGCPGYGWTCAVFMEMARGR